MEMGKGWKNPRRARCLKNRPKGSPRRALVRIRKIQKIRKRSGNSKARPMLKERCDPSPILPLVFPNPPPCIFFKLAEANEREDFCAFLDCPFLSSPLSPSQPRSFLCIDSLRIPFLLYSLLLLTLPPLPLPVPRRGAPLQYHHSRVLRGPVAQGKAPRLWHPTLHHTRTLPGGLERRSPPFSFQALFLAKAFSMAFAFPKKNSPSLSLLPFPLRSSMGKPSIPKISLTIVVACPPSPSFFLYASPPSWTPILDSPLFFLDSPP